ncbi:L [Antarctic penguin virus B]|uniref:RNA-directed RNA polymerase L n=1 Tax=Antarctic penguin virus B TaxID=2006073 RepID=A0A1Y0KBV5_9MONO|nr:L [Antarctic penguin virus B] [Antarctic penguin virus B]ARU83017.1 L [Antarctic penguin virus B] [Antarctic penguin virus B]
MPRRCAMANKTQIILPDSHLSSPLVLHKLLYYWKLTGLPLPEEYENDDLILTRSWGAIRNQNSDPILRCVQTGAAAQQYLNHKTRIRAVCHPRTLSWLTRINSPAVARKFQKIADNIRDCVSARGKNLRELVLAVQQKLGRNKPSTASETQSNLTSQTSPEFEYLINHPDIWFTDEWANAKMTWLQLKQMTRFMLLSSRNGTLRHPFSTLDLTDGVALVSPDVTIIISQTENKFTCLHNELILAYSDMLEGRSAVSTTSRTLTFLQPLHDRISDLLHLIDQLFEMIGNPGYEVVALLESLAYASVQLLEPTDEYAGDFLKFNLSELHDIMIKHLDSGTTQRLLTAIANIYSGLTEDQGAELLCMLRLWSHPLLSARAAANKVRKTMCAPKLVDLDTICQVLSFFNCTIINGYRRANSGLWPKIDPRSILSDTVRQLYVDSAEIPHSIMLSHYKELSQLDFMPTIVPDPVSDLSMFLKDKAIAKPRPQWLSSFKQALLPKEVHRHVTSVPGSNRLLIDFLESNDFDPYKEMDYLNSMAYLSDDDVSISYSLKEKEVKVDGRIFAKLTKKLRNCQVMAEGILAKEIAPFFKGNGVVQDQISLTKTMLTMSQLSLNCNRHLLTQRGENIASSRENRMRHRTKTRMAVFLTTDLEKYCTNWRYQVIKPFARSLNRLLGFDHFFEWIHLRLADLTMYVGDPFNPPVDVATGDINDQPNDDIFIVSARGGIEGLCQKLWTMISISAINLAAARSNCRVACMVQGDNQVLAVTKEINADHTWDQATEELHQVSNIFFRELIAVNHGIGHNLKLRETVRSETFFVYSKRIFKDGRILSQILKNASKLVLISGDLSENIPASCGNISSTITRICENGAPKDYCFLLNYIMTLLEVQFECMFSVVGRHEPASYKELLGNLNLMSAYVLTPTQVGGLNNLQYSRLYARNIGDPVTAAFADLRRLISSGLIPARILYSILAREPGDGTWLTLCSDPYALNQPLCGDPGVLLKRHTQRVLFETCSNPLLAGVYSEDGDSEEMTLAQALLDQRMVHPRVAHAVMECTSIGRRKQIQGLIDTTNTIIKIALDRKPLSLRKLTKIVNYSGLHMEYFIKEIWNHRTPRDPYVNEETCSLTLANYCRTRSWSNLLAGRNIQGVTSPDVLEMVEGTILSVIGSCSSCESGDTQYTWFHLPSGVDLSSLMDRNPTTRVPYLGSKTQERRTASLAKIANMSPHVKAALRAASLVIWAYGDCEENWEVAHALASSRCNIDLEHLKLLSPLPTSGNLQHRLDDGITQTTFTPASLYRVASFIHISNDSQRLYEENSAKESNIIYQQIMLTGLGFMESLFPLGVDTVSEEVTLHLHTGTSCCIREVDLADPFPLLNIFPEMPGVRQNRFMYDATPLTVQERTVLDVKVYRAYELNLESYSTLDLMDVLASSTGKLIGQSIVSYDAETSIKNDAIVTYDNSRNWISEAQNCDVLKLLEYAALEIILDCGYQAYYLRIVGIQELILYMNDLFKNMPGLLLGNLAATISHPVILERLYSVGFIDYRQVPQLAHLDFVALAAEILSRALRRVLVQMQTGTPYNLLFPSTVDDDLSDRMFNMLARYNCLLCLIFGVGRDLPIIRNLTAEEKCQVMGKYLSMVIQLKNLNEAQAAMITQPQIITFPTNLYYMSRKSLNIIRERDDKHMILSCIFPDPVTGCFDLKMVDWSESSDRFLKEPLSFNFEFHLKSELSCLQYCGSAEGEAGRSSQRLSDDLSRYLFRGIGTSSTSWYKASNLLSNPDVRQSRGGDALYIAEGSGATMSLIEHYIPHRVIYYNSFFSNCMNPPQRHFGPAPVQFIESVPYKNIQAQVPCQDGFVQEFRVLWRENAAETDITRDQCVNFICQTVPPLSLSLVVCDLELDSSTNWEAVKSAYINIATVAAQCLKPGGVLVIKALYSRTREFSFMYALLWTMASRIVATSNGYSCRGDYECYLIVVKGDKCSQPSIQSAVVKVMELDRKRLTVIGRRDEENLLQLFLGQLAACQEVLRAPMSIIVKTLKSQPDEPLLAVGGQPVRPAMCELAYTGDDFNLSRLVANYLDTVLKTAIYYRDEQNLVETAFLLTPFNIHVQGKIKTLIQGTTRQLLEAHLIHISPDDLHMCQRMLSAILSGAIAFEDFITVKMYLSLTGIRKYILKKLGKVGLLDCFSSTSRVLLTRPEQKLYMKMLGNAMKGYYQR